MIRLLFKGGRGMFEVIMASFYYFAPTGVQRIVISVSVCLLASLKNMPKFSLYFTRGRGSVLL